MAGIAILIGLALGLLGDLLVGLWHPELVPSRSYDFLGQRGLAIAAETLSALGLTLVVGAYFGRVLPALLIAVAIITCAFVVIGLGSEKALYGEAMLVGTEQGDLGRVVEGLIQTPDGALLSYTDAMGRYGYDADWLAKGHLREMVRLNPWATYPVAVARIALLHVLLGLAAITAGFAVMSVEHPDVTLVRTLMSTDRCSPGLGLRATSRVG
jgi:hypothetical protein